jgi:DNA replication protein DnaC
VLAERRAGAGIPPQYHGRVLSDLESWPGEVILACQAWATQGGGLLLTGDVGTGKTTAAAAACWQVLERRRVEWVRASQLARWSMAGFNTPEYEQAQRLASGRGDLVLDDLGQEPASDSVGALIFDTIQSRIDAGAALLITSNYQLDELTERNEAYGQRLASRLFEYCHHVHIEGRDQRLRGRRPFPGRRLDDDQPR